MGNELELSHSSTITELQDFEQRASPLPDQQETDRIVEILEATNKNALTQGSECDLPTGASGGDAALLTSENSIPNNSQKFKEEQMSNFADGECSDVIYAELAFNEHTKDHYEEFDSKFDPTVKPQSLTEDTTKSTENVNNVVARSEAEIVANLPPSLHSAGGNNSMNVMNPVHTQEGLYAFDMNLDDIKKDTATEARVMTEDEIEIIIKKKIKTLKIHALIESLRQKDNGLPHLLRFLKNHKLLIAKEIRDYAFARMQKRGVTDEEIDKFLENPIIPHNIDSGYKANQSLASQSSHTATDNITIRPDTTVIHHNGSDVERALQSPERDATGNECQEVLPLTASNPNISTQQVHSSDDIIIGVNHEKIISAATKKIIKRFKTKLQKALTKRYISFSAYLIKVGCLQEADKLNIQGRFEMNENRIDELLKILSTKGDGLSHLLNFLKEKKFSTIAREICDFAVGFMKDLGVKVDEIPSFLGSGTKFDEDYVHALFSGPTYMFWLWSHSQIELLCEKVRRSRSINQEEYLSGNKELPLKLLLWLCLVFQVIAVIALLIIIILFCLIFHHYRYDELSDDCALFCVGTYFKNIEMAVTVCCFLLTFAAIVILGRDFAILDIYFDYIFAGNPHMDNVTFFSMTSKSVSLNLSLSFSMISCIYIRAYLRRFSMITLNKSVVDDNFLTLGYLIGVLVFLYGFFSIILYLRLVLKLHSRVSGSVYRADILLCPPCALLLCAILLGVTFTVSAHAFADAFDYSSVTFGIVVAYIGLCFIAIVLWSLLASRYRHPSIIVILVIYGYFLLLLAFLTVCPGTVASLLVNTRDHMCYVETGKPYYCVNGCSFDRVSRNRTFNTSTCARC